jgi:hypothetical protein
MDDLPMFLLVITCRYQDIVHVDNDLSRGDNIGKLSVHHVLED